MSQNGVTVGVRLRKEQIEHVKLLARKLAYEKNEKISFSSLVRDALDKTYPIKNKK